MAPHVCLRRSSPAALLCLVVAACGGGSPQGALRADDATRIPVDASRSLQNPCFSPDGSRLVFTHWLGGYNRGRATVGIVDRAGGAADVFTGAGAISVNLPGSCWIGDRVVYSTDEFDDRDEIYLVDAAGGTPRRVTNRPGFAAFEPSLSPHGAWVVFESHVLDVEGDGALFKVRSDGSELTMLTDGSTDDRQPNWSPAGDLILFQSHRRVPGNIDIYTMDVDGGAISRVTTSVAEDTDASFSPDGARIVYSSNEGDLPNANLFVVDVVGGVPIRASVSEGYDGAPSWSPDGRWLAFESSPGEPDGSAGTELWIVPAPM